jgi:hypothetical protein
MNLSAQCEYHISDFSSILRLSRRLLGEWFLTYVWKSKILLSVGTRTAPSLTVGFLEYVTVPDEIL